MATHSQRTIVDDKDVDDEEKLVKKAEELVSNPMFITYSFLTAG
jgi:hypothetical protein